MGHPGLLVYIYLQGICDVDHFQEGCQMRSSGFQLMGEFIGCPCHCHTGQKFSQPSQQLLLGEHGFDGLIQGLQHILKWLSYAWQGP